MVEALNMSCKQLTCRQIDMLELKFTAGCRSSMSHTIIRVLEDVQLGEDNG